MAVLGIDLGTSNSLVGYWNGEKVELIDNVFGKKLTPSVVGIDDNGDILIGEVAKQRLITHPECTVSTFKRYMGTDKKYAMEKYTFTPIELSAILLNTLKEDAEHFLKQECRQAIISVPAYFNNIQREATIEAAKLAGLEVLNIISEPTAAAMAYGIHNLDEDSTIIVIDLGGGTFDVSLLEMFEGIMQIRAIAGDNHLGGEDFTWELMKKCLEENEIDKDSVSPEQTASLYNKMEFVKQNITGVRQETITFSINNKDYKFILTQDKIEKIWSGLLARMKIPIIRTLQDTSQKIKDIDKVILIGGGTKSSIIRKYFSRLFAQIPYTQINQDEAVAIGASIQAALKIDKSMMEEMILTDVCAFSLGVETCEYMNNGFLDGYFCPIIERNTTIPVSKVQTLNSIYENQNKILMNVYQGEGIMVENNLKIGEIQIPLPRKGKGQKVDVRFTYDTNGVLEVIVTVKETNVVHRLYIENTPGNLSQEQMEEQFNKLRELKIHPRERSKNRLLLARADRIYSESLGERRLYIGKMIISFKEILEKQDELTIRKASREFQLWLNQLEGNLEL